MTLPAESDNDPHLMYMRAPFGGVTAQVWHAIDYGVGGWKRHQIVACHKLPAAQARWPIDALISKYPAPLFAEDSK